MNNSEDTSRLPDLDTPVGFSAVACYQHPLHFLCLQGTGDEVYSPD